MRWQNSGDEMDLEFSVLQSVLNESGCSKKQIAAGTYVNHEFVYDTNSCSFDGPVCPRLNMPSGTGYELCKSYHAEKTLVDGLIARGEMSDGVMWVTGHYWACEACASAAKAVGVKEIRVRESTSN